MSDSDPKDTSDPDRPLTMAAGEFEMVPPTGTDETVKPEDFVTSPETMYSPAPNGGGVAGVRSHERRRLLAIVGALLVLGGAAAAWFLLRN